MYAEEHGLTESVLGIFLTICFLDVFGVLSDLVEYLTGKSMSFIEQVRITEEEELVDEPEPEDEQKNELGSSSFWNLFGTVFQTDNEEKNEVENSSSESPEESPDLESIEPPVKAANSIKEKVLYVPGGGLNLLSVG